MPPLARILKKHFLLVCLLIMIGVLYSPVFKANYVWDDLLLFVANNDLRSGSFSWDILSKPILAGASYFRPFVLLSFVIEFYFSNANPLVSHIINLTFFLLNIILLYITINLLSIKLQLKKPVTISISGATLYAVHPALIETTAWVSGRFDLFAATFILLGLVFFLYIKNDILKNTLISLCLLLALGSKEIGLILIPALFFFQIILLENRNNFTDKTIQAFNINKKLWLSLILVFSLYLALRINSLGHIYNNSPLVEEIYQIKGWQFVLPLQTFIFYIKSILFPFFSSPVHTINPDYINSVNGAIFTGLAIFLIILLAYFSIIRQNKSALLFSISFIALLPVMHIVTLRILDNIGHDRFLTVPLIFFIIGFVLLPWGILYKFSTLISSLLKIILICWLSASILTIYSVLPFWTTEFKLWSWAYHREPTSKIARASYIAILNREQRNDLLAPLFEEIKDDMDIKEQLIYSAFLIDQQNPDGILYLRGVLESVKPFHEIYKTPKDAKEFINMFDPLAFGYYQLSGYYLIYQSDYEKAFKNAQIALWYFPNSPPIITRNALALYALGDKEKADKYFQRAVKAYHYSERDSAFKDRYYFLAHECYWKRIPENICEDKNLLNSN